MSQYIPPSYLNPRPGEEVTEWRVTETPNESSSAIGTGQGATNATKPK